MSAFLHRLWGPKRTSISIGLIPSKKREPRRAFDLTRPREPWGVWQGTSREGEAGLAAKDFRACREPDTRSACSKFGRQGQRVQSSGEEGAIWLELAAITLAMAIGFSSRVGSGTLENKAIGLHS